MLVFRLMHFYWVIGLVIKRSIWADSLDKCALDGLWRGFFEENICCAIKDTEKKRKILALIVKIGKALSLKVEYSFSVKLAEDEESAADERINSCVLDFQLSVFNFNCRKKARIFERKFCYLVQLCSHQTLN